MTASAPFRFDIIKTYPRRGPLQQYRAAAATAFVCFRCRQAKAAKLIATSGDDHKGLLCNACYGHLLSVWEIRAGAQPDAERDNGLLRLLAAAVNAAQVEEGRAVLLAREARAADLSAEAQTLLSTAEAVRAGLVPWQATDLDWSVAALPLCKAVEVEIGRLITRPLRETARGLDLGLDAARGELRAMVKYCRSTGDAHMMLGPFISFMKAITTPGSAHGPLAEALRAMSRAWPHADWLFDPDGLAAALDELRVRYRNPAAHTAILDRTAFEGCSSFIGGTDGLLWRLLSSTRPR